MSVDAVAEVSRRARELYGREPGQLQGVVHVVSSVQMADGRLHVIRIGPAAPKSERDFFVLNFWRAQCDAILTTAQVVRAEPTLSHELQGPLAAELGQYRREVLGKTQPPLCAILTRSASLPAEHPLWHDRVRYAVLSPLANVPQLTAAVGGHAEVVGFAALDVRGAVAWLRARGAGMIMIEAGPSTAVGLYDPPGAVAHLLLSRCEGALAPAAIGGELPQPALLFAGMQCVSERAFEEQSGPWRFAHWQRM